jgi:hypothetical protein
MYKLLNINIIHYDYIGYGLAKEEGIPTEQGVYESVEAVFKYLKDDGVNEKDIIL